MSPDECKDVVKQLTHGRGADSVIEVAGGEDTFRMAWEMARPNVIVTIVAMYDKPQITYSGRYPFTHSGDIRSLGRRFDSAKLILFS